MSVFMYILLMAVLVALVGINILFGLEIRKSKAEAIAVISEYDHLRDEYDKLVEQARQAMLSLQEVSAERDRLADIVCGDIPKSLGDLSMEIHKQAVAHGWWEDERCFPEIVALCHSELSEALEEYRNSRPARYVVADIVGEMPMILTDPMSFEGRKPEGIAVEMADCIIRILDWCGKEGIDIDDVVEHKMAYNATRPYKHGNKVC